MPLDHYCAQSVAILVADSKTKQVIQHKFKSSMVSTLTLNSVEEHFVVSEGTVQLSQCLNLVHCTEHMYRPV